MASRPPRRTRTQRAVTVIHFDKPPPPPPRRATTRAMPAVVAETPFDDEDTAVTAPGEAFPPPADRSGRSGTPTRTEAGRAQGTRPPTGEDPERLGPTASGYLVEVPRDAGGEYNVAQVTRLLKGQQAGHPFPPLTDEEVTELACFGRFLFETGRLEDAQRVLEGLVASGVLDAFPYSMLGTVYLARRDLNRALALFEAALSLAPTDLAAHVYRAEIRVHQGRADLAMVDIRYALEHGERDDPFTARAAELKQLVRRR